MNINGKTELIGLLGWPVSHTKSPLMHNAVSIAYKRNLAYVPLSVHPDAVQAAVAGLPALGFIGVNVTVPHKQAVMACLDYIDPAAQAIGAVNTILFAPRPDGTYPPVSTGYNTDWLGLQQDLNRQGVHFNGRDCLVLGAGGSARAVVYMLLVAQANVHLFARRIEQADALVADMRHHFPHGRLSTHYFDQLPDQTTRTTRPLIINTTPVGMHPHIERSIWPDNLPFPADSFVYDLVYTPVQTKIMTQAQTAGCGVSNGLGMLFGQGAEAYRIWTGIDPDIGIMEQALR